MNNKKHKKKWKGKKDGEGKNVSNRERSEVQKERKQEKT